MKTNAAWLSLVLTLVAGAAAAQMRGQLRVEPGARTICVAPAMMTPPTEYIAARDAGSGVVDLEIGAVGAPGSPHVVAGIHGSLVRLRVELATGTMWCIVHARITGLTSGEHDILLEHASQASSGVLRAHLTVR